MDNKMENVNIEQLHAELSSHDPDGAAVLRRLHAKQRTRRHRMIGALTAVTLVVGAASWLTTGGLDARRPDGQVTAPAAAAPPVASATTGREGPQIPAATRASGGAVAAGEACVSLRDRLANAVANGFSVIVGRGVLTGRTGVDGYDHGEMRLTGVRTLAGPRVAEGDTAWVRTPQRSTDPDVALHIGPEGPLWGPDGALFGIYVPKSLAKGPLGTIVYHIPVVGDRAVLAKSGCWNYFGIGDLTGTAYRGAPLTEIPGSGTYARLAASGLVEIPLSRLETLLPK